MSENDNGDLERQIKLLRDQIARLISQNLELQRQLEDLRRAKTDTAVESLAATVVRSVQSAEQALTEEAADGQRFVISELQTMFRGVLLPEEDRLALRLPLPEYGVMPGQLSSVEMTFAKLPTSPVTHSESGARLADALEQAQMAFIAWSRGPGSVIARNIVDQLTQLLGTREQWGQADFIGKLQSLTETVVRFGDAVARQRPVESVRVYRTSAENLLNMVKRLAEVGRVTSEDLEYLATEINRLNRDQQALRSV